MKWHRKIISIILAIVMGLSVLSVVIYHELPTETQDTFLFGLIVLSGWTSGAGLTVSLWVFNNYEEKVDQPLEQLTDKTGDLVEDLSEGFLEDLIDSLIRAEKRFSNLSREKQKRVVRMVDKYSETVLRRIEEMPEEKPSNRIDKAEEKQVEKES